jgi:hypothetical protein
MVRSAEGSTCASTRRRKSAAGTVRIHTALAHMARLRSTFTAAEKNDPTVALRYPSIASFFQVRDEIAQRGAVTRKRRNAEKKNNP